MDGVLADFDQACLDSGVINRSNFIHKPRSEWTLDEKETANQVSSLMGQEGWWLGIPPMPDYHELWAFIKPYKPVILTARPKKIELAKQVYQEKRDWITKYLGPVPDSQFICCLRSEKKNFIGHAPHRHQILIDDLEANIRDWENAGGTGILHTSAKSSIEALKEILFE